MNLFQLICPQKVSICFQSVSSWLLLGALRSIVFVSTFGPDNLQFSTFVVINFLSLHINKSSFLDLCLIAEQCKKSNCQPQMSLWKRHAVRRVQNMVCLNLTPVVFKRFSKNDFIWFCQQCCPDANRLITEAIPMVNGAKEKLY